MIAVVDATKKEFLLILLISMRFEFATVKRDPVGDFGDPERFSRRIGQGQPKLTGRRYGGGGGFFSSPLLVRKL
jgi:hypothetical protein